MSEALLFLFSLVDTGALIFLLVYFVITISDFECDYINGQECCAKLNFWTLFKLFAHAILLPLFLILGHWQLTLVNILPVSWMAYEYLSVPSGNLGVYDPFEIHKRLEIRRYMRDCLIFLAWYLISFFVYLYCFIITILKDNPLEGIQPTHVPEF